MKLSLTIGFEDDQRPLAEPVAQPETCQQALDALLLSWFDADLKSNEQLMGSQSWPDKASVELYFTDEAHIQALNFSYRHKDKPTNVLSFAADNSAMPQELIDQYGLNLGELIMCMSVLTQEATQQHKSLSEHFIHLLIHGVLHLLGLDHENSAAEQQLMERIEINALSRLAISNPYL